MASAKKQAREETLLLAKKAVGKINSMASSGKLGRLSVAGFRALEAAMQSWLNGESAEFIQDTVADWLAKNGIAVRQEGIGFAIDGLFAGGSNDN